jgi:hypothetical protein
MSATQLAAIVRLATRSAYQVSQSDEQQDLVLIIACLDHRHRSRCLPSCRSSIQQTHQRSNGYDR